MAFTKKGIVKKALAKETAAHEKSEPTSKEKAEGKNDKEVDAPFKKFKNLGKK